MTLPQIRNWYNFQKGTRQGIPVEHISINIVAQTELQPYCEAFIEDVGLDMVANDYNANPNRGPVQTNACHDSFQTPFLKPTFVIINCVSNSPNTPLNMLLLNQGGGASDDAGWSADVSRWRAAIEAVQAPPAQLTAFRLTANGGFRFTFPGQFGRTNQILGSQDLTNWSVLASFYGTNGPIVFRDDYVGYRPRRFYKVRRL